MLHYHNFWVLTNVSFEEEIDLGTMIFFLTATIDSIILGISGILIAINCMSSNEKESKGKISAILLIIALILFVLQILLGFLSMMGIL